ncbi:inositol monophosphatase family protein [Nocardia brasiliensis]|uniref:inositol monophosphatase family protein n=1 Tax=Nocardia brasiliensis TaxID=37326 RepID=UPI00245686E7|nr:inositol monophosphatase family protein [Nocardia brasiliensis]
MDELVELLRIARTAVAIGGELLRTAETGTVHNKDGDRDFVTDLDLRIQDTLQKFLATEAPAVDFLGEEDSGQTQLQDTAARYRWILDPIDGTSNFIHGIPLCAVSLALTCENEPVIGVIGAPLLGVEYYSSAGAGAFELDGSGTRRLTPRTSSSLSQAVVSIGDYATGAGALGKNARRLALTAALAARVERVRMLGTAALDLAWVAQGRTDACVLLSNKPWDTAAGVALVRESGGRVVDAHGADYRLDSDSVVAVSNMEIERDLCTLIDAPEFV